MSDESVTELNQQMKTYGRKNRLGLWLLLSVFIMGTAFFVYGYYQLADFNISLAKRMSEFQKDIVDDHSNLMNLEKTVHDIEQFIKKSQDLSAQQERLVNEWRSAQKGNLEKWYVAEAQYLVNLANDQLQFNQDISMAKVLLQRADQVLAKLQNPSVLELRKSIAKDLGSLQSLPETKVTELYLHLTAINNQIDQLPLPAQPLKPSTAESATTKSADLPWWQNFLASTWQGLRQIVIIRNTDKTPLSLVLPDEKVFLYQNLHAQMESAMWAVLHHNADVYQMSLSRAIAWIQQYFDQKVPATQLLLQHLQEMRPGLVQLAPINLSATLQLFDNYFSQNLQGQAIS